MKPRLIAIGRICDCRMSYNGKKLPGGLMVENILGAMTGTGISAAIARTNLKNKPAVSGSMLKVAVLGVCIRCVVMCGSGARTGMRRILTFAISGEI